MLIASQHPAFKLLQLTNISLMPQRTVMNSIQSAAQSSTGMLGKTNQTKSLLLSSQEFKRPLQRGAWWRDLFLLVAEEDAEGLLSEANPPLDDCTAAKAGTDKLPSPAAASVREGTTFPELFPLPVALLPLPPLVLAVLLLLVLGTELAPPALCCGRLLDIIQPRLESPQNPPHCRSKHPDCADI